MKLLIDQVHRHSLKQASHATINQSTKEEVSKFQISIFKQEEPPKSSSYSPMFEMQSFKAPHPLE